MIKIDKKNSHLGDKCYSMDCSCALGKFFVNATEQNPLNYSPVKGMVQCPWCHIEVALSVILNNYENSSDKEDDTTPVVITEGWNFGDGTLEEQK